MITISVVGFLVAILLIFVEVKTEKNKGFSKGNDFNIGVTDVSGFWNLEFL